LFHSPGRAVRAANLKRGEQGSRLGLSGTLVTHPKDWLVEDFSSGDLVSQ